MRMVISGLFTKFFNDEKIGGFILILCTVVSILIANSDIGASYLSLWHVKIGISISSLDLIMPLEDWINDGLMAIFFLLVGLEIERELYQGELSSFQNASLPVLAAIGGMLVPALIFLMINNGASTQNGFGIPMATDIAFSLGVLSLIGKRVPLSLKVFLTALAIIDDLGAILVIALFYSKNISLMYLGAAAMTFVGLVIMNRIGIHRLIFYIIPGVAMWFFMLKSGIHATIAGVLLAFCIPYKDGDETSPSSRLETMLDKPVPFVILPLFALANTCVVFSSGWYNNLLDMNSLGILAGLIIGKPVGILLFSIVAVKLNISRLPDDIHWTDICGAGILAGIGFTMSIFITLLAYNDAELVTNSKIAIFTASIVSAVTGLVYLYFISKFSVNKVHV